ncbi:MAG: 3-isopropylmalate dehydratase large subunit [Deltaproteobacteria bacterium]|nr:3-isopropylmalate dehydratase large subunit [Deltaproteobacteria bacterium]
MTSLLDKLWTSHLVKDGKDKPDLLYIDRHLIHEVTSNQAFDKLRALNLPLRRPDLTCGVIDHSIPTDDRTRPLKDAVAEAQLSAMERNHGEFGFEVFFGCDHPCQGVIHVTMPEEGLILPGHSVVCGDSHTATHGAVGALAFGIGTSEVAHVLATQTMLQNKPKTMAVRFAGKLKEGVTAKDLILHVINVLGVSGGTGYALEYAGEVMGDLSMAARFTLSNMSIECGARFGLIAPDEVTFAWLKDKPRAPKGKDWDLAVEAWRELATDKGHKFDKELEIDLSEVDARVTWGTNPAQSATLDGKIPAPGRFDTPVDRQAAENSVSYQGLTLGSPVSGIKVDYVFIGSCTNGRYEDLVEAAEVLKGRKVKEGVTVLVVPGSNTIKVKAEENGLDRIFTEAGCQWRHSGCSMCLGMNPDVVPPGNRCVSTSNRNFEGRQGYKSRTHLASPSTAAASAVAGYIVSAPELNRGRKDPAFSPPRA